MKKSMGVWLVCGLLVSSFARAESSRDVTTRTECARMCLWQQQTCAQKGPPKERRRRTCEQIVDDCIAVCDVAFPRKVK